MDGFREFTTVAEMNAFYQALRARREALAPPPPSPPRWQEAPPRKVLEPEPELEPQPLPAPAPGFQIPVKPIERIIAAVCAEWEITPEQLRSRCRKLSIVTPRQVVMHLAKSPTVSAPYIARHVGLADHSTVINGLYSIERKMRTRPELAERVERVKAALEQDTGQ